jgi:hypothetical protein
MEMDGNHRGDEMNGSEMKWKNIHRNKEKDKKM